MRVSLPALWLAMTFLSVVAAVEPLAASEARAADSTVTWDSSAVSREFQVDIYAQHLFGPTSPGAGLGARQFDVRREELSLAVVQFAAGRPATGGGNLGYAVELTVGRNADQFHATEPGGPQIYKYVQQAYASYALGHARPFLLEAGQFAAWCGYEGPQAIANENYSRSFLYTLGQPSYHMGVRFMVPTFDRLSLTGYAVNGWNEVEDPNTGKTFGLTAALTPGAATGVTLNAMHGREGSTVPNHAGSFGGVGFLRPGVLTVSQLDGIVVWQPWPSLHLAVNADITDASAPLLSGGHWSGQAFYIHFQPSDRGALGARWEQFEDTDGLRTGVPVTMHSLTLTMEARPITTSVIRLELRADRSTIALFPETGTPERARTTLTVAQILRF